MPDEPEMDSSSLEPSVDKPLPSKPQLTPANNTQKPGDPKSESPSISPKAPEGTGQPGITETKTAEGKSGNEVVETPEQQMAREKQEKVREAVRALEAILDNNKQLGIEDGIYTDDVARRVAALNVNILQLDDLGRYNRDSSIRNETVEVTDRVALLRRNIAQNNDQIDRISPELTRGETVKLEDGRTLLHNFAQETDPQRKLEIRGQLEYFLNGLDQDTIAILDEKIQFRRAMESQANRKQGLSMRLPDSSSHEIDDIRGAFLRLQRGTNQLATDIATLNRGILIREQNLVGNNREQIRRILDLVDQIDGIQPRAEAASLVETTIEPAQYVETTQLGPMAEGAEDLLKDPRIGSEFRIAMGGVQTALNISDEDRLREQQNLIARFEGLQEGMDRLVYGRGPNINEAILPPIGPTIPEIQPFLQDPRLRAEVHRDLAEIDATSGISDAERVRRQQLLVQRSIGLLEALRRNEEMDRPETTSLDGRTSSREEEGQKSEAARDPEKEPEDEAGPEAKRSEEEESQKLFEDQFLALCQRKFREQNPGVPLEGEAWINYVNNAIKTFETTVIDDKSSSEFIAQFNMFKLGWLLTTRSAVPSS